MIEYNDIVKCLKLYWNTKNNTPDELRNVLWRMSSGNHLKAMLIAKAFIKHHYGIAIQYDEDAFICAFDNVCADLFNGGTEMEWSEV